MSNIPIYTEEDFVGMRKAGEIASDLLDYITDFVAPEITTGYLDDLCYDKIKEFGVIAAPLGYHGFPKPTCISVNHVVCHGIPSHDKKLKDGDILNIDVTVIVNGYYGDTSRMYYAGIPSIKAKRLTQCTYDCMMFGIEQVKPGNTLGDIGFAIQSHAEKEGFSVVRDFCGHGLGKVFHDEPQVLHYGQKGKGLVLEEGMMFTIEPMINAGKYDIIVSKLDSWTATTRDKSLSAQFEHSMAVTKDGVEIFTLSRKGYTLPPYNK